MRVDSFIPLLLAKENANLICLLLLATLSLTIAACDQAGDESDHKIVFPASAANIQNRGDSTAFLPDRGIATLLDIDRKDLDAFVGQLRIKERKRPVEKQGDPTVNGWNVWPHDAESFVPGNAVYSGFKKTWNGDPVPVEMLSCQSTAGDWLHVEIWNLSESRVLLKLFTDWN